MIKYEVEKNRLGGIRNKQEGGKSYDLLLVEYKNDIFIRFKSLIYGLCGVLNDKGFYSFYLSVQFLVGGKD